MLEKRGETEAERKERGVGDDVIRARCVRRKQRAAALDVVGESSIHADRKKKKLKNTLMVQFL